MYIVVVLVSLAPTTVLKLMGSCLVFVVAGFILVLFCLEAQLLSPTQSSFSVSPSAAAAAAAAASATAAEAAESNGQKLQLKVINEPSVQCRLYGYFGLY